MSESWDEYAAGWDVDEDAVLYSRLAYETLCEVLDPVGLNILDFGCGTGLLTERMSPTANRIVALDTSEKMISILNSKQLDNVDTLTSKLTETAINSNRLLQPQFDLIVASSVCAFLPDYESTLQLLKTLLEPNGVFVQWDWLSTGGDSDFGLTEEKIESAFVQAGMAVSSISQPFALESKKGSMQVIMGVAKNA